MPRKPRMYLPDVPCHVIQRGNNRSACFFAEADFRFYLDCVKDAADKYQVAVHAYVLMTNHVHLLMTPVDRCGISKLMQSVGRRYVQYVNKTYKRTGTLWEDRHKASLVQADDYLLVCQRYIEMNPVRAGMVEHPGDYPWSSYRYNAYGATDGLVHQHSVYLQLNQEKDKRVFLYRELFAVDIETKQLHAIRKAVNFSIPLGNDRFRTEIESILKKSIVYSARRRPRIKPDLAKTL